VNNLTTFVRSLNLDILIDLSGYTTGNRHEILAKRSARIQMLWLGYNNSLGLKNLDYLITDKNLIKPDELSIYNEKILYLPKIWNALSPSENYPDIDVEKENNSNFTFCSFNNLQKISDRTIKVWSEILKHDDSVILLKDHLGGGEDLRANILNKFRINGVKSEKVIVLDRENKIIDHLKLYNKANVALDTFPYFL
jgi:predicted O-linked N-acetylglucosamine transferase (SPINDLY family)